MDYILSAENLSKNYNGKKALDSFSVNIKSGRIVGLLGPNGSGKTTLLKLAAGLLTPNSGSIKIADMAPCVATKKLVSYLPERTYLSTGTRTLEALDMFEDFYEDFDKAKALDMLSALKITPSSRIAEMSKGTREKMQLVLVMSRVAKLYLLDEPIGGVDPAARDYILNTILNNYADNATVLISTHLISDIEKVLDEVVFINEGRLALQKDVDEMRAESSKSIDEIFREVYKC